MLVRKWQNIKFTKNFHIKSVTLIPSRLFFMSRWKFTHQVYYIVISCQFFSRNLFVDQVSCFDIKFLIFVWNTIFFSWLYNFVEGRKDICQVYSFINQEGLVMTRLKELGWSGNYVLWNSTWPRLWISSQDETRFRQDLFYSAQFYRTFRLKLQRELNTVQLRNKRKKKNVTIN